MSKSTRVLYMEDDAGLARLLQKKLENAGYEVHVASNGEEGLKMFETGQYDIVAVDQNMPVHNGLEVIRILSTKGSLPPTIMVTGTGDENIAVEAMKLGAGDYIVKDVDGGYLELIPSVIDQVLQQQRLAEEKRQAVEALKQRNRDLGLLNQLGQSLTATLDLQQVIDQLLHAVTELVDAQGGSVWLWDENMGPGWLICQGVLHHGLKHPLLNLRLSPGEGIAGWVAQHSESAFVNHAPNDRRFTPNIDTRTGFHTKSLLAVPLRVRDAVIGVVEVVNKKGNQFGFSNDDCALIETLAASGAIAIDNARLVKALRHQTEELKARNDELDAFAHTVAHDLKSPLGVIIGYADMLEEEGLSDNEERLIYLEAIAKNGHKMSNIIDELLLLAEVRKTDVKIQSLDMYAYVTEAQQRLAYMIEESNAQIDLPEFWPTAKGYGPWIEEVWANYISNAIKYGGTPPHLELGAEEENELVRFWVKDNGEGLAAKEKDRLFTPFTQLNQVRVTGHGLGLSIVRRIIEKLGGEVGVESDMGNGSTFYFTLPKS